VNVNNIARWNGSAWSGFATGVAFPSAFGGFVNAVTMLPNGDLLAGGTFTTAGTASVVNVARWNGTSWSAFGGVTGGVVEFTTLANGGIAASTGFCIPSQGSNGCGVVRWNGSAWLPLGTPFDGSVLALTTLTNGDVLGGGLFWRTGSVSTAFLARLATTCPATAVAYGTGCMGSGGLNELTVASLPWAGGAFAATATGMPATALALAVTGFTMTSLPMPSVLTQGVAGCTLLVTPDRRDLLFPVAGAVTTQIAIPNTATLVGQVFHHQVVPIEVDGAGTITAVTSTNALTMTIGAF
jgi:hypothetical protein